MAKYSIELRFEVVIAIENGESINGPHVSSVSADCGKRMVETLQQGWC